MIDFLFYGDTDRSAAIGHERPVTIGDPFLLGVVGGRTLGTPDREILEKEVGKERYAWG